MVKNIFIGFLLGWFVLLAFMPKQELYYKLEQELAKNDIKINEKRLESGLFSLTLHQSDIYVKGIKLATAEKVNFFTLLFYSTVNLEKLHIDETLKAMLPTRITTATSTHAIWNPMNVDVLGEGSFGGLEGIVNLAESTLRLDFNDSNSINNLKPHLQEDEKGWHYETSF
jgi:hypothetical protein